MNRWTPVPASAGTTTRGWTAPLFAILVAAALSACGNLTAGGVGEASVAMSGDAPEGGPAPQMALVSGPASTDHLDDDPEGEVEAELAVFLVAESGALVPITDGEVRVRVDLQGVEEPEIGAQRVAAATYTDLRIVFREIEAEVDAGLIIGGEPVTGPIDVEIEGILTIDRPIDIVIGDGERVELLVDLNADSWLQAVDPLLLTVDAQVFADLVSVRRR